MPSKKRKVPDVQEILDRPWCYYCERDFDDMKILISHQRAKHFKCETCGRRLNTIGGLHVHLSQVHKETLTSVENALEHRTELGPEIFGMEGVPAEVLAAHKQRITEAFFKLEADRRTATGNPAPGGGGQGRVKTEDGVEVKKRKIESLDEIKKRLAKQRARKQAEKMGVKYESESEDEKEGDIKSEIKREVKSEVKSEIKSETDSEMQADWSPVKTEVRSCHSRNVGRDANFDLAGSARFLPSRIPATIRPFASLRLQPVPAASATRLSAVPLLARQRTALPEPWLCTIPLPIRCCVLSKRRSISPS